MNRSAIDVYKFVTAVVLSMLLTVSLLYVTLDAPRIINEFLLKVFPDCFWDFEKVRETIDLLRPWGYAMLATVIMLTALGFVTKREHLSVFGSVTLYLPIFGYFAFQMFFLAGVGVLRALWFPLLDISPTTLKLGHIVYVPYFILSLPLSIVVHGDVSVAMALVSMSVGLFTFFMGVATWLYGKFRGKEMIDFWVYRYSRHPQYLGFLLWSYGLLLLATFAPYPKGGYVPRPTLPWLVSSLIVIGVALQEETQMVKVHGEKYVEYRRKVPFMVRLPRILVAFITAPMRLLSKDSPENAKEVICAVFTYLIILVLLSIPLTLVLE
jgi:protein-S-isoprenylcysteine O-methyltransferase Ste14